jgi:phosphoribosylanthranilate isomerase
MRCRVKICGVTSVADAMMAVELGADAIGLNFYAKSPRCIDDATARAILAALPPTVQPIMLAVHESWETTRLRWERLPGLQAVQIHHPEMTPCPHAAMAWIAAFAVQDASSVQAIDAFLDSCRTNVSMPEAILVDAHAPGSFGGTGRVLPWPLLHDFRPGIPRILAGGLTPENVADAVRSVRPDMVDVASGVESTPGRKDSDKMARFIAAVRNS